MRISCLIPNICSILQSCKSFVYANVDLISILMLSLILTYYENIFKHSDNHNYFDNVS